jgi:arylsulfatase
MGDWKLVAIKNQAWELYDLRSDRGELRNLAAQQPEKARELLAVWQSQMDECIRLASVTNTAGNPVSSSRQ